MKIQIEIEIDKIPENCKECKFFINKSTNSGRTYSVICFLTGVGDSSCEYSSEEFRAIEIMQKKCPIIKGDKND